MKRFFKSALMLMAISIMLVSCRDTDKAKNDGDEINTELMNEGDKVKIKTDDKKVKIKVEEDGDIKKKVKIDD